MQSMMQSIKQSTLSKTLKLLSIPLISLAISACGGGGSATIIITPDRISEYNGDWQSDCKYDNSTGLSTIDTLYVTDTEYTFFTDAFDNTTCFGASDYTTEIDGYLYYGSYKPFASNYCENTIEVDFAASAIYENGIKIPSSEISYYLDLPSNTSYNLMCTLNGELFLGDLSFDDGTRDSTRPLSLNYNKPYFAF